MAGSDSALIWNMLPQDFKIRPLGYDFEIYYFCRVPIIFNLDRLLGQILLLCIYVYVLCAMKPGQRKFLGCSTKVYGANIAPYCNKLEDDQNNSMTNGSGEIQHATIIQLCETKIDYTILMQNFPADMMVKADF